MSFPLLTIITFAPLLGALVILFLPKENERTIKNWSVLISLLPLALSIFLWFAYNKTSGGYQFQEVFSSSRYSSIALTGSRTRIGMNSASSLTFFGGIVTAKLPI